MSTTQEYKSLEEELFHFFKQDDFIDEFEGIENNKSVDEKELIRVMVEYLDHMKILFKRNINTQSMRKYIKMGNLWRNMINDIKYRGFNQERSIEDNNIYTEFLNEIYLYLTEGLSI